MYKVGLTGGIGSGKSKVAELLHDRGVAVYDSDSRAKELMNGDEALRQALIAEFGAECYTAEGLIAHGLPSAYSTTRRSFRGSMPLFIPPLCTTSRRGPQPRNATM